MNFKNIEIEQASLGSQILSDDALIATIEYIDPLDYYRTSHQIIYKTIKELFKKGIAVDLMILINELLNKNLLEKIGGVTYLTHLINSVPNLENIEYLTDMRTKS